LLDLLYATAGRARRRYYERHPGARRRLRQPVISVGNLSVGGSAKTPLVARIARFLLDRGESPAILSRGYGRTDRREGVVVVSDGMRALADVAQAGDEPLMLAETLPGARVVVCDDRHLAGVLAEDRLGATVHVLDDGFQHVRLSRDLDILMTTAGETASGRVLPYGRLREAVDAASRAHFVVVLEADLAAARAEAWTLGISGCAGGRRVLQATHPIETPVVAVAGIAQPAQFFRMLEAAGYEIARTLAFADHHPYRRQDLARIADVVRETGAVAVVTTEKDAVRLAPLRPLPFACGAAPMALEIDGWEALTAAMEATLERVRESR
jgi:tetraacyldisaccharide 4'-kinase